MNNAYTTHKYLFETITENKLNELLKRADTCSELLQNHINERLDNYICTVHVNTNKYKNNNNIIKDNNCYIIIKYYNQNGTEIGHITLHLNSDNKFLKGIKQKNGRFHVKNQTKNCYTLKCNKIKIPTKNNSISMSLPSGKFMRPPLKYCTNITLDVLNMYFDFNSNLSLSNKLTEQFNCDEYHICLKDIKANFSKSIGKQKSFRRTVKK